MTSDPFKEITAREPDRHATLPAVFVENVDANHCQAVEVFASRNEDFRTLAERNIAPCGDCACIDGKQSVKLNSSVNRWVYQFRNTDGRYYDQTNVLSQGMPQPAACSLSARVNAAAAATNITRPVSSLPCHTSRGRALALAPFAS